MANVFDQIDPTHIGRSIKKLNDSKLGINNELNEKQDIEDDFDDYPA